MAHHRNFTQKSKILLPSALQNSPKLNELLNKGRLFHQKGDLKEALAIYQQILDVEPNHLDALQLAGSIAGQTKCYVLAIELLSKAVQVNPKHVHTFFNLGIAYQALNQFESAISSYDSAIKLKPDFANAYFNHGNASMAIYNFRDAVASYEKFISLKPDFAVAYFNLANALRALNEMDAAIISYDKAIRIMPNFPSAYINKGLALYALEKFKLALASYDEAIKLMPEFAEAYYNRGNALKKLNQFDAAVASYDKAINFKPDCVEAYSNKGVALDDSKQSDAAIASYNIAISVNPSYVEAYSNRGIAEVKLQKFDAAIESYDQAININPNYADAYWNKSALKILLGEYEEGWRLWEWRWKAKELASYVRNFTQPLWLGQSSIKDQAILIHAEQGLGDSIQFCRYIAMLEALAPKEIILEVPKALMLLLSSLKNQVTFIEQGHATPEFDLHCPMMSLPHAFKTIVATIPADIPYLFSEESKAKRWQDKLGPITKPRIGLVWSGSTTHKNDHNRSLLLKQLTPLFDLPFEFHSLQKEIRPNDLEALNTLKQVHQHQDALSDFTDTAALIENMDLVISVDTSVAHLAGAMGKEVFILLPFAPDYRWMLDRSDSPWYPTASLFRQPEIDDWYSVIDKVRLALVHFQ